MVKSNTPKSFIRKKPNNQISQLLHKGGCGARNKNGFVQTIMDATKECNSCWNIRHSIEMHPENAKMIITKGG
jgi:hypothetical protein